MKQMPPDTKHSLLLTLVRMKSCVVERWVFAR